MESSINEPHSLFDDIGSNSSPYFLGSSKPTTPLFVSVSDSGVLPGSEEMQGGLDGFFEGFEANSSGQSTQDSQATLDSLESHCSFLGIGGRTQIGDEFLDLNAQIMSNSDLVASLQAHAQIGFGEQYQQEMFFAGSCNGLTQEQLDLQAELASPFSMGQATESATGDWYADDDLVDLSSVITDLDTPPNDESIQSPSQVSSTADEVRSEKASRRERNPRTPGGYQCDLCVMKFDLQRDLTRHRQKHSRTFPCGKCSATFAYKKDLDRHVICVHDRRRNYICHICNKRFGRKDNMRRHCAKVHQEDSS